MVCDDYAALVAKAGSKAALAALLDVNVCEWLCMMEPRHGASEWLREHFAGYANGRFVSHRDGYTCSLWTGFLGDIALETTVTAVVGCPRVRLLVPDRAVMRVFASGGRVECALGEGATLVVDATEGTEVVREGDGGSLRVGTIKTL